MEIKAILKKMTEQMRKTAFILLLNDKKSHIAEFKPIF
jgi:hypothetical protein